MIMEVLDLPPDHVLEQSTRRKLFFDDESNEPLFHENSKVRIPGARSLESILGNKNPSFLDFVERCLDWDPRQRMEPFEAL